jgi:hypothetical protein
MPRYSTPPTEWPPMYLCLRHGRTTKPECCGTPTRPMHYCPYCNRYFAKPELERCEGCGKPLVRHKLRT